MSKRKFESNDPTIHHLMKKSKYENLILQLKLPASRYDSIYRMNLRSQGFKVIQSFRHDVPIGTTFSSLHDIVKQLHIPLFQLHKSIQSQSLIHNVLIDLIV